MVNDSQNPVTIKCLKKTTENWKMNMLFGIVIALYTHDYTIVFVASAAAREKAKSTA